MTGAFLAGVLIGIGDIALMMVENKIVGAALFSLALLSIIKLQIPLFTGRIGYVMERENPLECILFLLTNSIGSFITVKLWGFSNPDGAEKIRAVADAKYAQSMFQLLMAGILCGVLIHIAITVKSDIVTVLCIMCFILSGFRHCIADAAFTYGFEYFAEWMVVVIGNSLGAIVTELLVSERGRL